MGAHDSCFTVVFPVWDQHCFLTKICSGLGYTSQSKQTYKSIREIIILPVNISTVNKFVCQMAG